ncbi:hypothetical protein ACE0DR_17490 [Azotobacter sp. CWF10]
MTTRLNLESGLERDRAQSDQDAQVWRIARAGTASEQYRCTFEGIDAEQIASLAGQHVQGREQPLVQHQTEDAGRLKVEGAALAQRLRMGLSLSAERLAAQTVGRHRGGVPVDQAFGKAPAQQDEAVASEREAVGQQCGCAACFQHGLGPPAVTA